MALDWDTPAKVTNGVTDTSILVQRAGEHPFPVGVPAGMTAREQAEILHGFDGYSVQGFGYGPHVEHPRDCRFCAAGETMRHNYEPGGDL